MKIADSAILSNEESKKAPLLEVRFVVLATLPSTISKKPETKSSTPPIATEIYQSRPIEAKAYTIPAVKDTVRDRIVQKSAESPDVAKNAPNFVIVGSSLCLSLLSKSSCF